MARIAGIDLPNKPIGIALTYIYGIGRTSAQRLCTATGLDASLRMNDVGADEVAQLIKLIDTEYRTEGRLRTEEAMNIKRLMDIGCYRGIRHRRGLPLRGQRTRTNARTRKGKRKTMAGKRKAPTAK
jgi:small subunit ribosomal protein S13